MSLYSNFPHSNIIGLSGKINSGKNFSAKIIQFIIVEKYVNGEIPLDFINNSLFYREKLSKFKEKAFADNLKYFASVLSGTKLESFYSAKNEVLPKPFDKYTRRTLLTTLGEKVNEIAPNYFIDSLMQEYKKTPGTIGMFDVDDEEFGENWIVTDVRFPEEKKAIEEAGGVVVRVDRSLYGRTGYTSIKEVEMKEPELISVLNNKSETALDNTNFKHRIEFNGQNIPEFIKKWKNLLNTIIKD